MHDRYGIVWRSHYWARVFQLSGHTVKLISPQFVKPFVKTNKNDAEAITEADSRPSMHFVLIKQVEQQDILPRHRIRSRLVKNRTALINEIRGLNLEYGIAIPTGASKVRAKINLIISNENNELTALSRDFMSDLYNELVEIEGKLKHLEKKVKQI